MAKEAIFGENSPNMGRLVMLLRKKIREGSMMLVGDVSKIFFGKIRELEITTQCFFSTTILSRKPKTQVNQGPCGGN